MNFIVQGLNNALLGLLNVCIFIFQQYVLHLKAYLILKAKLCLKKFFKSFEVNQRDLYFYPLYLEDTLIWPIFKIRTEVLITFLQ